MSDIRFEFAGVDEGRWGDLAALFEARGGPHACWCMVWREKPPRLSKARGKERSALVKKALHERVSAGTPIGILGYDGDADAPVAWCSVAPRSTYRALGGLDDPDDGDGVWSIVCFFVKRDYRGKGVTDRLLDAAIEYARSRRAKSSRRIRSIRTRRAIASWASSASSSAPASRKLAPQAQDGMSCA